jgi:hypothetical protein
MDAVRAERLGRKWTCFSCGVRFYDFSKAQAVCPRCSNDQSNAPPPVPASAAKPKRKAAKPKAKPKPKGSYAL